MGEGRNRVREGVGEGRSGRVWERVGTGRGWERVGSGRG